ncbi:hypothetical protein HRbin26_01140 [bacterium HR26]|nr:hypothetical protein HRbin26_01140 [bacterium HR26]
MHSDRDADRAELLERLRRFPDRVANLVEDLSVETLRKAGCGGQWGAVEILAYLRDFDAETLQRLERILTEDEPEISEFDPDLMAIERGYAREDPFEALAAFRELRQDLVHRLSQLGEEQWQRTARHPEFGRVTLAELIERLAQYDQDAYQRLRDVLL